MGTSIRSAMRLLVIGLAIALVGCGPNWEQINGVMDKQLEIEEARNERLQKIQEKPSGNRSSEEGVAYQMRMAFFQMQEGDNRTDIMGPVLNYAYKVNRLPLDWFNAFWSSPNTGLVLCEFPLDCGRGSSGGTTISAKNSDLRGAKFTMATDGSVLAQDEATAANRKSSVAQDDAMAATDDGQNIDGEGNTQGQVVTRPNTQKDLDFAGDGGDSSDGDGGDAAAGDNNAGTTGFGVDVQP